MTERDRKAVGDGSEATVGKQRWHLYVINRGNYRRFIFESEGAKQSFEKTLFEACERFSWELMAYCVLSNHFHLCVGTPLGNLSSGMRWLQATFATRFNRYRQENGHLFQGRFKALTVEPGDSVVAVVNYIHLNPLRAGLESAGKPGSYRWSSLYHFPKRSRRPNFLCARWMSGVCGGADDAGGWRRYRKLLEVEVDREPEEVAKLEKAMTRGWCIGSAEFKKALVEDYFKNPANLRLEHEDLREVNRIRWAACLEQCLRHLKKTPADIRKDRLSAPWKLAVAVKMKRECSVTNLWLSEQLRMGAARGVSSNCSIYLRQKAARCIWTEKLKDLTFYP